MSILDTTSNPIVVGTTRYDGVLYGWAVSNGIIQPASYLAHAGHDMAGLSPDIASIGDGHVFTGGGENGYLRVSSIDNSGALSQVQTLSQLPASFAGLHHFSSHQSDDGTTILYGSFAQANGIASLAFDADAILTNASILPVSSSGRIATVNTFEAYGHQHLITSHSGANTLSLHRIGTPETLETLSTLDANSGLWINAPTSLGIAEIEGRMFAILGAAGSDSLTVVEIGPDGSMIVRDHILDTRDTRFDGVSSVEVIQAQDRIFILAGGADDGVTVFTLLSGGHLVPLASIEDTDQIGLQNVSAITGYWDGNVIQIFAASAAEVGLTQLRFDMGSLGAVLTAQKSGQTLIGTAQADILQGHDGDDMIEGGGGQDILRDGHGSDTLRGGDDADIFIMSADAAPDTITDFTVGQDKIDLSLWPMLRDISQLFLSITPSGMEIRYGSEQLFVHSVDNTPIDYRILTNDDLIGATRFATTLTPGYPGPATPIAVPEPPDDPQESGPYDPMTPLTKISDAGLGILSTALGQSGDSPNIQTPHTGQVLNTGGDRDLIIGRDEDDTINAGSGDDTVFGRGGSDKISGAKGADTLFGGDGDDEMDGGDGDDWLSGGAGNDTLTGGMGADLLFGDAGADTFVFKGGTDQIRDFEQGIDALQLDASLWTGLTSAEDLLFVYGSIDATTVTIAFDPETRVSVNGITDYASFADDILIF